MRMKTTLYGLLLGALVFATGCPEDNNDPKTNNQPHTDMSTDQSEDIPKEDMMPDADMSESKATACTWLRTQPATLALKETPQDITVVFGCNGTIRDDIILKRPNGDTKVDRVTCKAGGDDGPTQQCDVSIKGVTPTSADAADPETLTVTIPVLEAIDTTLRWHYTLEQLAEQTKDIQTYDAPNNSGPVPIKSA